MSDNLPWTALDWESRPWTISDPGMLSRTQVRKHTGPDTAAVPPALAMAALPAISEDTNALVDDASNAASRFDAEFGEHIAPFDTLLLRTESSASSRIENLTASARTIALTELGDHSRRNGAIVVANSRAMRAAIDLADDLGETTILEMHRALLEATQPETVGRWRDQQVWIGGGAAGPHQALFVPPHADHVGSAMADLIAFMDRDDIPVLTHAALAHAQFETIHPFPDGNGRTGRALMHAMFVNKGLTRNVTVPISAGMLTDVDGYFDSLTAFRDGQVEPIVALTAESVLRAVSNGTTLVTNLRALRERWSTSIEARKDSAIWRILDLVMRQPVIDSTLVVNELDVTIKTALDSIERLVDHGALSLIGNARRNRKWEAPAVLAELDAFARRAGRRQQH